MIACRQCTQLECVRWLVNFFKPNKVKWVCVSNHSHSPWKTMSAYGKLVYVVIFVAFLRSPRRDMVKKPIFNTTVPTNYVVCSHRLQSAPTDYVVFSHSLQSSHRLCSLFPQFTICSHRLGNLFPQLAICSHRLRSLFPQFTICSHRLGKLFPQFAFCSHR